jgi:hypothetical protein
MAGTAMFHLEDAPLPVAIARNGSDMTKIVTELLSLDDSIGTLNDYIKDPLPMVAFLALRSEPKPVRFGYLTGDNIMYTNRKTRTNHALML